MKPLDFQGRAVFSISQRTSEFKPFYAHDKTNPRNGSEVRFPQSDSARIGLGQRVPIQEFTWRRMGSGVIGKKTRGAEMNSAPLQTSIGLERKASNQCAGALTGGSCFRNDGTEAAAVQTPVGAGSERGGSGREVPRVNRRSQARRKRVLNSVEDIRELRANLQSVTFFDAEGTAEVGVLRRVAHAPEGANRGFVVRELPVGDVRKRKRVQHLGLGHVKAVAVDIERVGVMGATVVGPIHRPGTHARNQLRRARSVAEDVADGRGAGTGGLAHQSRALVI